MDRIFEQKPNENAEVHVPMGVAVVQLQQRPTPIELELDSLRAQYGRRLSGQTGQLVGVVFGIICVFNLRFHLYPTELLFVSLPLTTITCLAVCALSCCIKFDLTEPFGLPLTPSLLVTFAVVVVLEVFSLCLVPNSELRVFCFAFIILLYLMLILSLTVQYVFGGRRQSLPHQYHNQASLLLTTIVMTILLYMLIVLNTALRLIRNNTLNHSSFEEDKAEEDEAT